MSSRLGSTKDKNIVRRRNEQLNATVHNENERVLDERGLTPLPQFGCEFVDSDFIAGRVYLSASEALPVSIKLYESPDTIFNTRLHLMKLDLHLRQAAPRVDCHLESEFKEYRALRKQLQKAGISTARRVAEAEAKVVSSPSLRSSSPLGHAQTHAHTQRTHPHVDAPMKPSKRETAHSKSRHKPQAPLTERSARGHTNARTGTNTFPHTHTNTNPNIIAVPNPTSAPTCNTHRSPSPPLSRGCTAADVPDASLSWELGCSYDQIVNINRHMQNHQRRVKSAKSSLDRHLDPSVVRYSAHRTRLRHSAIQNAPATVSGPANPDHTFTLTDIYARLPKSPRTKSPRRSTLTAD